MVNDFKIYDMISKMNIFFGNAKGLAVDESKQITENGKKRLYAQLKNLIDENSELEVDGLSKILSNPTDKEGRKEIFDAICDLTVFLYGANHFLDLPLKDFHSVLEDEKNIVFYDGATFSSKEQAREYCLLNGTKNLSLIIDKILHNYDDKDAYQILAEVLSHELHLYFDLFKKEDPKFSMIYLNKLVFDSNMSKLCKNEDEVNATLSFYRNKDVVVDHKVSELIQDNGEPYLIVYSPIEQFVHDKNKDGEFIYDEKGEPVIKEYRKDKFLKNVLGFFEPNLYEF